MEKMTLVDLLKQLLVVEVREYWDLRTLSTERRLQNGSKIKKNFEGTLILNWL